VSTERVTVELSIPFAAALDRIADRYAITPSTALILAISATHALLMKSPATDTPPARLQPEARVALEILAGAHQDAHAELAARARRNLTRRMLEEAPEPPEKPYKVERVPPGARDVQYGLQPDLRDERERRGRG